ncbi:MAG: response regulator, partial [Candidatus Rokubacteria bacterium]|nr:response regulator [Candidatus Rokubacteria bacterium]
MPAKILVVDDTSRNVKLLADLLAAKGYTVATADSGPAALKQIESEPPDLVLLDVVMPGMTGYEVCRKIRENPATGILPVVMVTALDPAEERVNGLEAGADDFLTKPINQPELLARVRSLLRIKHLYDTVQAQAGQLADWNQTLERRVQEQVAQLERLGR